MAPSSYYWTISFMYVVILEPRRCGVRVEKNLPGLFDLPNIPDNLSCLSKSPPMRVRTGVESCNDLHGYPIHGKSGFRQC
jgi:hypothetical protein